MLLLLPCLTFHCFFLHSVCLTLYLDSPSAPFIHKRGGACPSPSFFWKHCADFILGEHSLLSSIHVPELTRWPPASLGKRCILPLPLPPRSLRSKWLLMASEFQCQTWFDLLERPPLFSQDWFLWESEPGYRTERSCLCVRSIQRETAKPWREMES